MHARHRRQLKRHVLAVGALAALLVAPASMRSVDETAPSDRDAIAVVFAPRRQAVLSAEVAARITAVHFDLGEALANGDVLVEFDDLPYQANVVMAEARLRAANEELAEVERLSTARTRQRHAAAVLEAARTNLDVVERLFKSGQASQVDLTNAKRDVAAAETDSELVEATAARDLSKARQEAVRAEEMRKVARRELDACTLAAPYAGRVARVFVHSHELVDRGSPLVEIVDDTVLRAKFLLPSNRFRSIKLGQPVRIDVTETGETVAGHVTHIAATLDAASRTFEVYAEVDNAEGQLRAGMNGRLRLGDSEGK